MQSTLGRLFTADILTRQSRKDTGGISNINYSCIPFRWATFSSLVLCRRSLTLAHLIGQSHRSCYRSHLCLSCSEWVCIVCTAGTMKDRSGQIMWLKASGDLNIVIKTNNVIVEPTMESETHCSKQTTTRGSIPHVYCRLTVITWKHKLVLCWSQSRRGTVWCIQQRSSAKKNKNTTKDQLHMVQTWKWLKVICIVQNIYLYNILVFNYYNFSVEFTTYKTSFLRVK